MTTTLTSSLHELIFEVFEGELCGARELRLSQEEAESIRRTCPSLSLTPLPYSGGDKNWYELKFN